jgi:hypothetical protein
MAETSFTDDPHFFVLVHLNYKVLNVGKADLCEYEGKFFGIYEVYENFDDL